MPTRSFWENFAFGSLSRGARLTYLGLEVLADDLGNVPLDAALLRSKLYPYDADLNDRTVGKWVAELFNGFLMRYEVDGKAFGHVAALPLPKTPREVLYPPAPGQHIPKPREPRARVELPRELCETFERFIEFMASHNANKRITDGRRLTLEQTIYDIAQQFGVGPCSMGMQEAMRADAASENYVKAVAKNLARNQSHLKLVAGGEDRAPKDVRDLSLDELRRQRGVRK